jgi:acetolactate synthase-1/2/3 large subunit
LNVAEYTWAFLADHGVTHVFFLPGGGSMHLVDALIRQPRITPVSMLHEQACGIAADAYAQYTGNLGVCLVTSGPGGTNAVTPCAAAWIDSTPVLFISGQVATGQRATGLQRQGGPQEVDIVSIVSPITKSALSASTPYAAKWNLDALIRLAQSNPSGPVWMDIPLDVQSASI